MSAPKITTVVERDRAVRRKRTAEQNRRRNELNAQRRRETFHGERRATERTLLGLMQSLSSAEAQDRSRYLDGLIRDGKNLIR